MTSDDIFINRLRASHKAVLRVAERLTEQGLPVSVSPLLIRPDQSQWRDFADSGDLHIQQRIEVKHRSFDFGTSDWPHPDYLICDANSFDRAQPKPSAYVHVSADFRTVGIVNVAKTHSEWRVREVFDKGHTMARSTYVCDPSVPVFLPFGGDWREVL